MTRIGTSYKTERALLIRSYNRCIKCKSELTIKSEATSMFDNILELAHIYPASGKGPRHEYIAIDGISEDFIRSYKNIMCLCPTCHKIVDEQVTDFTPKKLIQMKKDFEIWIAKKFEDETLNISLSEVDVICRAIAGQDILNSFAITSDWSTKDISNKINKNSLSTAVNNMIKSGLSRADFIKYYLENHPDVSFADNLMRGIKNTYNSLKTDFEGDDLYFEVINTIYPTKDFSLKTAANCVVSYLFHECEIFEI